MCRCYVDVTSRGGGLEQYCGEEPELALSNAILSLGLSFGCLRACSEHRLCVGRGGRQVVLVQAA